MLIRNILQIPDPYRAVPAKKPFAKKSRPEIPQFLIDRKDQLAKQNIPAEIRYDRFDKSYYLAYRTMV